VLCRNRKKTADKMLVSTQTIQLKLVTLNVYSNIKKGYNKTYEEKAVHASFYNNTTKG